MLSTSSSERDGTAVVTRALHRLAAVGGPGRTVASHLDLARSIGARGLVHRWRQREHSIAAVMESAHTAIYQGIWGHAAAACGARIQEFGSGFLAISRGRKTTLVWRHLVMLDHPVTLRLSLDKPVVQGLLRAAALPVVDSLEFEASQLNTAIRLMGRGQHFVVKPANASGGLGVTCGVEGEDDLRRAALLASRWDHRLVIEPQAEGSEYRILVLDAEVLGAVRRVAPRVIGDGRSSVAGLIGAENQRRLSAGGKHGSRLITIDLDCVFTLRRAGLSLRSIPAAGAVVAVKTAVSDNGPEENQTVADVPAALCADAARAAAAVGLRFAGIDVLAAGTQAPTGGAQATILEVNAPPGLHYHYQVADRTTVSQVAVPLLEVLLGSDEGALMESFHRLAASRATFGPRA